MTIHLGQSDDIETHAPELVPPAVPQLQLLGPWAPCMDRNELVDRITRIVMAELSGQPASAAAPADGAQLHAYARGIGPTTGRAGCTRCDAWGPCPDHCGIEVRSALAVGATRASSALGFCPPDEGGIRARIDHTLLKPEASRDDIVQLCREAAENCFASVRWAHGHAGRLLKDSQVRCARSSASARRHAARGQSFETRRCRIARARSTW
jgi:hypothetical protein